MDNCSRKRKLNDKSGDDLVRLEIMFLARHPDDQEATDTNMDDGSRKRKGIPSDDEEREYKNAGLPYYSSEQHQLLATSLRESNATVSSGRGRGAHRTLPAWMTNQENNNLSAHAAPPTKRPCLEAAQFANGGGRGRGIYRTLPSWINSQDNTLNSHQPPSLRMVSSNTSNNMMAAPPLATGRGSRHKTGGELNYNQDSYNSRGVVESRGHPKFEPRDTLRDYNNGRDGQISIAYNNDHRNTNTNAHHHHRVDERMGGRFEPVRRGGGDVVEGGSGGDSYKDEYNDNSRRVAPPLPPPRDERAYERDHHHEYDYNNRGGGGYSDVRPSWMSNGQGGLSISATAAFAQFANGGGRGRGIQRERPPSLRMVSSTTSNDMMAVPPSATGRGTIIKQEPNRKVPLLSHPKSILKQPAVKQERRALVKKERTLSNPKSILKQPNSKAYATKHEPPKNLGTENYGNATANVDMPGGNLMVTGPTSSSSFGRGRGVHLTKPAWMTRQDLAASSTVLPFHQGVGVSNSAKGSKVSLPDEVKANIVSLLPKNNGTRKGVSLPYIKQNASGFRDACGPANAKQCRMILEDNMIDRMTTVTVILSSRRRQRYFLKDDSDAGGNSAVLQRGKVPIAANDDECDIINIESDSSDDERGGSEQYQAPKKKTTENGRMYKDDYDAMIEARAFEPSGDNQNGKPREPISLEESKEPRYNLRSRSAKTASNDQEGSQVNNKGGQTQVPKKDAKKKKKKKDAKKKKTTKKKERLRRKEEEERLTDKLRLDGHDIEEWLGERKKKFPDMDETESNVLKLILEVPSIGVGTFKSEYKARFGKVLQHEKNIKRFLLQISGVVVLPGGQGNVYIEAPKKVELIDLTLCSDSE